VKNRVHRSARREVVHRAPDPFRPALQTDFETRRLLRNQRTRCGLLVLH